VPEDRCHLNGLAIEDGRVRYVTACSASDSRAGWHAQRSAAGVLIDVVTDELIAEGLLLPHSPRVAGDAIYVLESGRAALVRLDRGSGRREDVMLCPGIARGLAFTGDYALLTISVLRDSDSGMHPLIEPLRQRVATPWCGLLVVDLRHGEVVHWLRFGGEITEMFDVAVIPEVRCPRGIGPVEGRRWQDA